MRNQIIKSQLEKLIKEREDLAYEMRQIGFNDMGWVSSEINYKKRVLDIDVRIDYLISQITEIQ